MIKTPLDIIKLALKDCGAIGVGQDPLAEDVNDALDTLNLMIAQWNRKRWLVYHLVDLAFTSTGASTYTVGPGGNFNISVRPDRLESAFVRLLNNAPPNQVDYMMDILQAREDYNRIPLKQLQSFPNRLFYDSTYAGGLGVIHPYPVPQASIYELHISVKDVLLQFPALTTALNLPNEYYAAIFYNLVVRLSIRYPISRDQMQAIQWASIIGLAKDSLNVLRGANTQIARLTMPSELIRSGQYNIYSDTTR